MVDLDTILNWIIPPLVVVFIGYILYVPFKKPIDKLVEKIKGWRSNKEETEEETMMSKSINYE